MQLASALGSSALGIPLESGKWVIGQRPCTPLATPAHNFFSTHGGDAKRGQSVVPPVMTDAEICDSLLPGLPLHPRVQWCSASHLWCRLLQLLGCQCWASSTQHLLFWLPLLLLRRQLVNLQQLLLHLSPIQLLRGQHQQQLVSRWCLLMSQRLCQLLQ